MTSASSSERCSCSSVSFMVGPSPRFGYRTHGAHHFRAIGSVAGGTQLPFLSRQGVRVCCLAGSVGAGEEFGVDNGPRLRRAINRELLERGRIFDAIAE